VKPTDPCLILISGLNEGDYDKAIETAKTFLRTAKDDTLRAEAARVVADSLRKKKDWQRACLAYIMLRDRFAKGTDGYVRYQAMADILRASPMGVYGQAPAEEGQAKPDPGPTLDADTAVAAAMSRLAATRAEKVKFRITLIKGARTAEEVIQRFTPVAVELRQLRVLWPEMPPDIEREAVQAAGMRMAQISNPIAGSLKSKQATFETAKKANRFTIGLRKEMLRCQGVSNDMAKAEESLTAGMDLLAGTAGWPEGDQLKSDSTARRQAFEALAKAFVPPPLGGSSGGGRDTWRDPGWRDRGGMGGPGML